jgi:hypothetical protein
VTKPQNAKLIVDVRHATPVSPFYLVKVGRENMQSFFIFGDMDLAGWKLTLAEKRLEEAQILHDRHLEYFANRQLTLANQYQADAQIYITQLKNRKADTNFLTSKYDQNQQKIEALQ